MSDDRRRKLEEIRNKKKVLVEQLGSLGNTISSEVKEPSKPLEQKAKEAIQAAQRVPINIDIEELKKKGANLKETMTRYKTEQLTTTKLSETFIGHNPEVYDAEVQCDYGSDEDLNSEEEEERRNRNAQQYRRSVIQSSTVKAAKNIPSSIKKYSGQFHAEEGRNEGPSNFSISNEPSTKINKVIVNDEMKRQIMNSEDLMEFLTTKRKYIERALGEKDIYDMFKTYYDEDDSNENEMSKRAWVSPVMEFTDESSAKRTVTSLEWSPKHFELLLAAYSKSDEFNVNHSNGLINLWSMALRKAPEFTFTCQTELTSAIFHKFNPKLVIGGTYTGQILIWDMKEKSLPIQKTPPGGKFHSHPIHCLGVTGTNNANHIISVSNDGVLCTWSLSNLSKPIKRIELKVKKRKIENDKTEKMTIEEIGALCMGIQENETNNIFLGADDSDIYQISLHQGNDNSDNVVETYRSHNGPVHSVDMHPGDYHKNSNFSSLFLSTSADWTMKLWSKNCPEFPLFSFDTNDDYVYDAKWHPTNASLFAAVDGSGKLDFWDLNRDVEVPMFRYDLGKTVLNKLSWSQDGKRLAVGDYTGKVSIIAVEKEIYSSKAEDSMKFEKIISIAKNNKKGY